MPHLGAPVLVEGKAKVLVGGAVVVRATKVTIGTGMAGSNVVAGAAVLVNGAMLVVAGAAVVSVLGTAVEVLGAAVEVVGVAVLVTAMEVAEPVVVATTAEVMSVRLVMWAAVVVADSCCRRGLQHTCREHAAPLQACLSWWELCLSWTKQQQSWVGLYCTGEDCLHDMFGVPAARQL